EHDLVKLVELCVNFLQAIGDGIGRKRRIVLLAGETLLLRGGQNMTVLNQRGCAVMVKCRNSENTHRCQLEERIDKRGDCGTLGQHYQSAKDYHHNEDRQ